MFDQTINNDLGKRWLAQTQADYIWWRLHCNHGDDGDHGDDDDSDVDGYDDGECNQNGNNVGGKDKMHTCAKALLFSADV